MSWLKKGLVYTPNQKYNWNQSHAQVPVVDAISDKVWRIYYATRDKNNISRTSFIEVEAGKPENILYEHSSPILELGKLGTFDDCGIMPTCIINTEKGNEKYLYYIGWTTRESVPYQNSIGIAATEDGITFRKLFEGPILTTTPTEPYFCGTGYVLKEKLWKMWYLSCTKWEVIEGTPEPFYNIKYAESENGILWKRDGKVAIELKDKNEGGLASAIIVRENNVYKMWFGMRGAKGYRTEKENTYRIGYADSQDGISWIRKDIESGITLSESGWDSEMISYPYVISHKGKKYMFYNGNGFGRSGFGYAVYE